MTLEVLHRAPEGDARPVPLLFVHGAWHGAWCWDDHFLPYFARHGYHAYALSLRGHAGSPKTRPLWMTGAWDYVADAAQVAARVEAEAGARPVMIGHSMGGYVVQKYLERHAAPAAALVATLPVKGSLPFVVRQAVASPLVFLKVNLTLSAYPMIATPQRARAHFFSPNMPADQVRAYHAQMGDEAYRIIPDSALFHRPRPAKVRGTSTPMLVLAAEGDQVFTISEQRRTAEAYGAEFAPFPDMAHDMMLEAGWESVAERLRDWLARQGL